ADLGVNSIEELVGRADLLRPSDREHPMAADLSAMLVPAHQRKVHRGYLPAPMSDLSRRIEADSFEAVAAGERIDLQYPVRNVDRAVGTRLSGRITTLHGGAGLHEETVNIRLTGTAGQSLGA